MRTLELPGDEKLEIKTTLARDLFGKTPPATVRRLNATILPGVDSDIPSHRKFEQSPHKSSRYSTVKIIENIALLYQ
jgi:hypothetical protein